MKIQFSIRPAELSDAPALAQAVQSSEHTVLVAEGQNDALLGYCSINWVPCLYLSGPEGYLSELFVAEDSRGCGIGGALLRAVVEEGKRRGCVKMQLINFRQRESYARGFYTQHGWEERPQAANFAKYFD